MHGTSFFVTDYSVDLSNNKLGRSMFTTVRIPLEIGLYLISSKGKEDFAARMAPVSAMIALNHVNVLTFNAVGNMIFIKIGLQYS